MYNPVAFRETRVEELHGFIRRHNFAAIITRSGDELQATHVPLVLDPERGPFGTLLGHVARANPHWRALEGGGESLVIFTGPHGYVSPAWYAHHPAVPTWDYTAVHAHGTPRLLTDPAELRQMLASLVTQHEEHRPEPWSLDMLSDEYLARTTEGIVGFEIRITRLEGKRKLSQNRPIEDRHRVVAALEREGGPAEHELAELIRRTLAAGAEP